MASNTSDPNRASGQLEFHDFLLKEIRAGQEKTNDNIKAYREETVKLVQRFDDHVTTCDKRYAAAQKVMTPLGTSVLPSGKQLLKKLVHKVIEKSIDYIILVAILIAIFAWKHGFQLPSPVG